MRSTFWGNLKQVISQLSIYATPITLVMSSITAWKVQIYPYLTEFGYDFHLWEFLLVLLFGLLIGGYVEWRYSVPSFFRAWTHSFYTEDNPLRQDIRNIQERLQAIEEKNLGSPVNSHNDRDNGDSKAT